MSGHSVTVRRETHPGWQGLVARCRCGADFISADSYESVEDMWREHVWNHTGKAPKPMGDTSIPRWAPAVTSVRAS